MGRRRPVCLDIGRGLIEPDEWALAYAKVKLSGTARQLPRLSDSWGGDFYFHPT